MFIVKRIDIAVRNPIRNEYYYKYYYFEAFFKLHSKQINKFEKVSKLSKSILISGIKNKL